MMIRKVFVPVDFSPPSAKAVDHAISMAREFSSALVLGSVIHEVRSGPYVPLALSDSANVSEDDVRARLRGMIPAKVRDSLDCRYVIRRGDVPDEILSAVAEEHADLVVMGTHGRRAFQRWFLGSATERVLRRVPIPVMTVSHPEDQDKGWDVTGGHIICPVDLPEDSDRGLRFAFRLAERFDARLTVLHAVHVDVAYGAAFPEMIDPEELRERAAKDLSAFVPKDIREDARVRLQVASGRPHEVILETASKIGAGLVVIRLHGGNLVERALLGSTAERVVRGASVPVLSIPGINADA